jgi:hypothetical protein
MARFHGTAGHRDEIESCQPQRKACRPVGAAVPSFACLTGERFLGFDFPSYPQPSLPMSVRAQAGLGRGSPNALNTSWSLVMLRQDSLSE